MAEFLSVNGKQFEVVKLLGHGKGGYSYLVTDGERRFVLKQIHHEPCSYYSFGNKLQSEISDYRKLKSVGVNMPVLLDVDEQNERILKQFIDGDTVFDLVLQDKMQGKLQEELLFQIQALCENLKAANLNVDYFPTNFVLNRGTLYYVDYECNDYSETWNFQNWGCKYWSKTAEFLAYVEDHKC